MSIRANTTTTPNASDDRLRLVLETGLRLAAPQAEKVPTAAKENRSTGEVTLTKGEWEKLKRTIEKKGGRLPTVVVSDDDDEEEEARPRMPSALELLLRPSGPRPVTSPDYSPTSPNYSPTSPNYSPTSPNYAMPDADGGPSAATWYTWTNNLSRTDAMQTLTWHFWLKRTNFYEGTVVTYVRNAFQDRMKRVIPAMFTSVPGETGYVLAPGNLKIPTRGFPLVALVDNIGTNALTVRVAERVAVAERDANNSSDDDELPFTLVQFHLRIERWLGEELLRVGLLGSHEIRDRGDALNTLSARMGMAFGIRHLYVPLNPTPGRWQQSTLFDNPLTPRMTETEYDDQWGEARFLTERWLEGAPLRRAVRTLSDADDDEDEDEPAGGRIVFRSLGANDE